MRILTSTFLLASICAFASASDTRVGDWVVTGDETIVGRHIRLEGNLVLEKGGRLKIERCTLEIIGSRSREHFVDWRGGEWITEHCTVGGFVRDDGTPIHTVFHLHDGAWKATDTVVQYSYGISFGHDTGGRLEATRLKAGPRPDAIIASGTADITLTECEFPIAVALYADGGGDVRFDLPVKRPIDRVFDASNTPGVRYRMELRRTVVPDHWFVFVRNIRDAKEAKPCEVTLGDCPKLIVSLLGHNVTGELRLSEDLAGPVGYGNVRIVRATDPVHVFVWALYSSGDGTDVTVRGPARICELMHRGGTMRLRGTSGKNDLMVGCTTLELGREAHLDLEYVHLGNMWEGSRNWGEANVSDSARLTGRHVSVESITFHTRQSGRVDLTGVEKRGEVKIRADGGPVTLDEATDLESRDTISPLELHEQTPSLPAHGYDRDVRTRVRVRHRDGVSVVELEPLASRVVGTFDFEAGTDGYVQLEAEGSRGPITADAVLFVPVLE